MPEVVLETRTVEAQFEMRDDATTGAPILEGYAATFDPNGYDMGPFVERIDPGAFAQTLRAVPDVRLLIDHEGQPLARTKSGTLTLQPDSTGLHARATLDPSDPDVQRLLPKMRRGDLDQMSFAFRVAPDGDQWDYPAGAKPLRTLRELNLNGGDVSVVTYPANPGTSVSVRAKSEFEAACLFIETIFRERRAGKQHSAETIAQMHGAMKSLEMANGHMQAAHAVMTSMAGPPPDAPGDDAAQANSMPLDLAVRIARSLSL
jgi:HK97 family phage prohead protease